MAMVFLITAWIYACVGFGGGSTYNALLVLTDVNYQALPIIALICNLIVVSGGVWHFAKNSHLQIRPTLPWIAVSIPAAWLGGYLAVPPILFVGVLAVALLVCGTHMLWSAKRHLPIHWRSHHRSRSASIEHRHHALSTTTTHSSPSKWTHPLIGGALGLAAGITGIGGGIFLAPILHSMRWAGTKTIAGTCSLFIWVNSMAGLIGHCMKLNSPSATLHMLAPFWLLFPMVLIGGQIGSRLGAGPIQSHYVKLLTALLILYVALRLIGRFITLM